MILKCETCGIDIEITEEAAQAIFERKRLQPQSKIACAKCFARTIIPPHYHSDPETGYMWREAP